MLGCVDQKLGSNGQIAKKFDFIKSNSNFLYIHDVYNISIVFCFPFADNSSASSRTSKGPGYQGFLRKRAGRSFGQKRAICVKF
jgi:hypothetical protein